jgi:hypothetical protein
MTEESVGQTNNPIKFPLELNNTYKPQYIRIFCNQFQNIIVIQSVLYRNHNKWHINMEHFWTLNTCFAAVQQTAISQSDNISNYSSGDILRQITIKSWKNHIRRQHNYITSEHKYNSHIPTATNYMNFLCGRTCEFDRLRDRSESPRTRFEECIGFVIFWSGRLRLSYGV